MKHKIGQMVGGGAGPELITVFREALSAFADKASASFEIIECPHSPQSYTERRGWDSARIEQAMREDIDGLTGFFRSFAQDGGQAVFRAPINAEALYATRLALKMVKTAILHVDGIRILLIRDLHQGFYCNDNWNVSADDIRFSSSYSKQSFRRLHQFSENLAQLSLRSGFASVMLYKHHLFANTMYEWMQEIDPNTQIMQPGTGMGWIDSHCRNGQSDIVVIAGNEIGDLIHEIYLAKQPRQTRTTAISKNYFLAPGLEKIFEYQTIHGSADDVAGKGTVNPIATLRATTAISDELFGLDASSMLEQAILKAISEGFLDTNADSKVSTTRIADYLIGQTHSGLTTSIVRPEAFTLESAEDIVPR